MNKTDAEQMLAQLEHGRSRAERQTSKLLDDLDARIEDVVMWCRIHAIFNEAGRSLRPARVIPPPLPTSRWQAAAVVAAARRSELGRITDVTLDGISGRLLAYFPDLAVADGAAEAASKDFFDVHGAPPCGTWVGYFELADTDAKDSAYLLAWIPKLFADLAEAGIKASSTGAIAWLSDTDTALRHIVDHTRFGRMFR